MIEKTSKLNIFKNRLERRTDAISFNTVHENKVVAEAMADLEDHLSILNSSQKPDAARVEEILDAVPIRFRKIFKDAMRDFRSLQIEAEKISEDKKQLYAKARAKG